MSTARVGDPASVARDSGVLPIAFGVYRPEAGGEPHRWEQDHVHPGGLTVTIRHIVVSAGEWAGMPESRDRAWVAVRHDDLIIAHRSDS